MFFIPDKKVWIKLPKISIQKLNPFETAPANTNTLDGWGAAATICQC